MLREQQEIVELEFRVKWKCQVARETATKLAVKEGRRIEEQVYVQTCTHSCTHPLTCSHTHTHTHTLVHVCDYLVNADGVNEDRATSMRKPHTSIRNVDAKATHGCW